eukprot:scaffold128437_cov27-Tisochrysis_lutea.AAC.4
MSRYSVESGAQHKATCSASDKLAWGAAQRVEYWLSGLGRARPWCCKGRFDSAAADGMARQVEELLRRERCSHRTGATVVPRTSSSRGCSRQDPEHGLACQRELAHCAGPGHGYPAPAHVHRARLHPVQPKLVLCHRERRWRGLSERVRRHLTHAPHHPPGVDTFGPKGGTLRRKLQARQLHHIRAARMTAPTARPRRHGRQARTTSRDKSRRVGVAAAACWMHAWPASAPQSWRASATPSRGGYHEPLHRHDPTIWRERPSGSPRAHVTPMTHARGCAPIPPSLAAAADRRAVPAASPLPFSHCHEPPRYP